MQGMLHVVLVDANIWFSRTLRDWVCMLATEPGASMYTVMWTDDILGETVSNLRKQHPMWEGGQISNVIEKIKEAFPCEEHRVRDFAPVESHDRCDGHVKGAAIACGADILLTLNARDFLDDEDRFPYEVYDPDDFFMLVWDSAPAIVTSVARQMAAYFHKKEVPYSVADRLKHAGVPRFACVVANLLNPAR